MKFISNGSAPYWVFGILLMVAATFTESINLSLMGLAWVIMAASINIRDAIIMGRK